MSITVDFEGSNFTFGPPEGLNEDAVNSCRAHVGSTGIVVCWSFNKEELEEIARTGKVFLKITAASLAPHFVTPFKPDLTQTRVLEFELVHAGFEELPDCWSHKKLDIRFYKKGDNLDYGGDLLTWDMWDVIKEAIK